MPQYYALLSIIYMMSFILLFDKVHVAFGYVRFCKNNLLSADDVNRLMSILATCQEQ